MHDHNCFLTLTYDDKNLPDDGSLNHRHFQRFMRNLRQTLKRKGFDQEVRYFMCGEYGEQNYRPHYHACLFGFDFPDKELWSVRDGNSLYRSATLERIWPHGFSTIGAVTWQSAAYVARYIMKKQKGHGSAKPHLQPPPDPKYIDFDWLMETGETKVSKAFEYTQMSKGIGKPFYDAYRSDLYPHDYVVIDGKQFRIPRYYDKLLERDDPKLLETLKRKRVQRAATKEHDHTPERLRDRETVKKAQVHKLKRQL